MFCRNKIKRINIITCTDLEGGIGKQNSLPWKCKEDMIFFKNITINNIVIMGRKTFQSINNIPLKNRINIVLSKTLEKDKINHNNLFYCKTLKNALNICKKYKNKEIFIIGGQKIYSYFLNKFENNNNIQLKLYITKIYGYYNCDVFFKFNPFKFNLLYKTIQKEFYCDKHKYYLKYDINCYIKT